MNVFQYGASEEMKFEMIASESGYKRITTFYSDLSIAEWCGGVKAVKETFHDVMKSWINDIKYITEFVISLNWKSWEFAQNANNVIPRESHDALARLYSDLYYKAADMVAKHYKGDEAAMSYYFQMTD